MLPLVYPTLRVWARRLSLGFVVRMLIFANIQINHRFTQTRSQRSPRAQGIRSGTSPHEGRLYQRVQTDQVCNWPSLVPSHPFMYMQSPDVEEDLAARFNRVLGRLLHNQEVAERRQDNTEAQLKTLVDELRRMSRGRGGSSRTGVNPTPPSPSRSDHLEWNDVPSSKDSTGNYVRVCH